jgi:hypothetical protein
MDGIPMYEVYKEKDILNYTAEEAAELIEEDGYFDNDGEYHPISLDAEQVLYEELAEDEFYGND